MRGFLSSHTSSLRLCHNIEPNECKRTLTHSSRIRMFRPFFSNRVDFHLSRRQIVNHGHTHAEKSPATPACCSRLFRFHQMFPLFVMREESIREYGLLCCTVNTVKEFKVLSRDSSFVFPLRLFPFSLVGPEQFSQ